LDSLKDEGSEMSPIYYLNMSLYHLATALKNNKVARDFNSHIKMAMLLEEKYNYYNLFGQQKKVFYF
jgi:hypothetical protein